MKTIFAYLATVIHGLLFPSRPLSGRIHAINDTNMFFRTSGAASLTATETSASITINGTPAIGLAWVVDIPKKSVGDTVQLSLEHSTDDSTYTTIAEMEIVASVTAGLSPGTPFKLVRGFKTRNKYVREVRYVLGTSPDFGVVISRIDDTSQWNLLTTGQNATANP